MKKLNKKIRSLLTLGVISSAAATTLLPVNALSFDKLEEKSVYVRLNGTDFKLPLDILCPVGNFLPQTSLNTAKKSVVYLTTSYDSDGKYTICDKYKDISKPDKNKVADNPTAPNETVTNENVTNENVAKNDPVPEKSENKHHAPHNDTTNTNKHNKIIDNPNVVVNKPHKIIVEKNQNAIDKHLNSIDKGKNSINEHHTKLPGKPNVVAPEDKNNNANTAPKENTTNNIASNSSFQSYQREVTNIVNQERGKRGLSPLTLDTSISDVATKKSQDMINKNYFDHTSPTYGTPFDMMRQFGITYKAAGENIAMGQHDPSDVMNAWMNSEGHRKNILSPDFTNIGVGIAKAGNGQLYWTQMFIGK